MSSKVAGIRENIYIGSWSLSKPAAAVSVKPEFARQDQRLSDGTLNRAVQIPYTGAPIIPTKFTFEVTFEDLNAADRERLARVVSYQDSVDFCPWLYICESFTGATTGTLQRRNAIDVIAGGELPVDAATRFAHWSYENGSAGNVTLGAIDTTNFRQAWAAGNSTLTEVLYYPVFRAFVTDYSPMYPPNTHREHWRLTLRER